jgi:hypothetical protein
MSHVGVGRMLVASLHQGISDLMPTRLEFYENWLHASGLRDGKIGLAPLAAVLSFLRQEGAPYELVTERAGEYAAQWLFDGLPPLQRSFFQALPPGLRARAALQLTRRVIRQSYQGNRASSSFWKGQGAITMKSSVFCTVRQPFARPLCGYYAAALQRTLSLLALEGSVSVEACQGAGAQSCTIVLKVPSGQK